MTLSIALRIVGWLLAAIAAGSATLGALVLIDGMSGLATSQGSMGLVVLIMTGSMQFFWQTIAGAAMALLCFAAARLLGVAR